MSNRDLIEAKLADFQRRSARRDMPGANTELVEIIRLMLDMIEGKAPARPVFHVDTGTMTDEEIRAAINLPIYNSIKEAVANSPLAEAEVVGGAAESDTVLGVTGAGVEEVVRRLAERIAAPADDIEQWLADAKARAEQGQAADADGETDDAAAEAQQAPVEPAKAPAPAKRGSKGKRS